MLMEIARWDMGSWRNFDIFGLNEIKKGRIKENKSQHNLINFYFFYDYYN
jgi:hypothetical protein